MSEIRMEKVTVRYGEKTVIDDISFRVNDGECFAILGPNACGKTTVVRALCGFNKVDNGEIYIDDRLVSSKSKNISLPPEKREIGVVFQDYAVWPHMTVYENIFYPLKKRRVPKDIAHKKVLRALEQVRMTDYAQRLPAQLSGGQQQRVAIARALVSSEKLIVLDEPITNLDANLREEMRFEIKELQKKTASTVIYITHDQGDAMAIADRMIIMDKTGRIRQIGVPEEIYKNPADKFVYTFLGASNFLPLIRENGQHYIKDNSNKIPYPYQIPSVFNEKDLLMASRPMEIKLSDTGSLTGKVKNVIYLGNTYEYRILLGSFELRVQQDSFQAHKEGVYQTGDECGIKFTNIAYYKKDEEAEYKTTPAN